MVKIREAIVVEGRYDKNTLSQIVDAPIFETSGFGIFKNSERLSLIRQLAAKSKIIVLTDSDGAGKVIRSHVTSAIPKDRLIQLYTPQVKGKERRKSTSSAEGFLGVEGTEAELLRDLLKPFSEGSVSSDTVRSEITKLDLFELGLTGGSDSTARRDDLAVSLGLPRGMTPNALLAALNVLMSREEFVDLYKK